MIVPFSRCRRVSSLLLLAMALGCSSQWVSRVFGIYVYAYLWCLLVTGDVMDDDVVDFGLFGWTQNGNGNKNKSFVCDRKQPN